MLTPLLFAACAGSTLENPDADASDDTGGDSGTDVEEGPSPAELVEPSAGACPDFGDGGKIEFESAGLERTAYVHFPEDAEGPLPIVFVWHPLGANARNMKAWLALDEWAVEQEAIVIIPDSDESNPFEWDFVGSGEVDLAVYDDLRTCAVRDLGGDPKRVSSTGMSAGALWTSFLGMKRGDTLSTIMPWSGGTGDVMQYTTPAAPYPALLVYGGESDTYTLGSYTLHFDDATLAYAEQLYGDGHFVATCNHEGGHDFPPDPQEMLTTWLLPHVYGEPSPFQTNDLDGLPDFCSVYAGPTE